MPFDNLHSFIHIIELDTTPWYPTASLFSVSVNSFLFSLILHEYHAVLTNMSVLFNLAYCLQNPPMLLQTARFLSCFIADVILFSLSVCIYRYECLAAIFSLPSSSFDDCFHVLARVHNAVNRGATFPT